MNLTIDNSKIQVSFDRIAQNLLMASVLCVNDVVFEITEIEFYYFYPVIHEDNYTHSHKYEAGKWRYHNQGLDITLLGNEIQDGGILIRGLKLGSEYINGPLKVVQKIYETFGVCTDVNRLFLNESPSNGKKVFKSLRHLPNKIIYPEYHEAPYRYFTELEMLNIPDKEKAVIIEKCIEVTLK
jgi:hypothetical protein